MQSKTTQDVSDLFETEVTLGLIFRVPLGRVESISAQLENLFGGRLIFRKFSPGRLYISDRDPREVGK